MKCSFWLYKGNTRVVGLYGPMSQFVSEPKIYREYSAEQVAIVLGNLENRLESKDEFDQVGKRFDQVRIYAVDDNFLNFVNDGLLKVFKIVLDDGKIKFSEVI
jgi:hypothetical protein